MKYLNEIKFGRRRNGSLSRISPISTKRLMILGRETARANRGRLSLFSIATNKKSNPNIEDIILYTIVFEICILAIKILSIFAKPILEKAIKNNIIIKNGASFLAIGSVIFNMDSQLNNGSKKDMGIEIRKIPKPKKTPFEQ
jgi:hypothetical protein